MRQSALAPRLLQLCTRHPRSLHLALQPPSPVPQLVSSHNALQKLIGVQGMIQTWQAVRAAVRRSRQAFPTSALYA